MFRRSRGGYRTTDTEAGRKAEPHAALRFRNSFTFPAADRSSLRASMPGRCLFKSSLRCGLNRHLPGTPPLPLAIDPLAGRQTKTITNERNTMHPDTAQNNTPATDSVVDYEVPTDPMDQLGCDSCQ